MKDLLICLGLLSLPAVVYAAFGTANVGSYGGGAGSPAIRAQETIVAAGRIAFFEKCARCHGEFAQGSADGPKLASPEFGITAMNNGAIRRVVRQGVPARRTDHGMPPVADLSSFRLDQIIAYLREIQRAQGIR